MNGPEHYREAERVRQAICTPRDASEQGFDGWQRDDLIALAQLHATLALAAASFTAGLFADPKQSIPVGHKWHEVLS